MELEAQIKNLQETQDMLIEKFDDEKKELEAKMSESNKAEVDALLEAMDQEKDKYEEEIRKLKESLQKKDQEQQDIIDAFEEDRRKLEEEIANLKGTAKEGQGEKIDSMAFAGAKIEQKAEETDEVALSDMLDLFETADEELGIEKSENISHDSLAPRIETGSMDNISEEISDFQVSDQDDVLIDLDALQTDNQLLENGGQIGSGDDQRQEGVMASTTSADELLDIPELTCGVIESQANQVDKEDRESPNEAGRRKETSRECDDDVRLEKDEASANEGEQQKLIEELSANVSERDNNAIMRKIAHTLLSHCQSEDHHEYRKAEKTHTVDKIKRNNIAEGINKHDCNGNLLKKVNNHKSTPHNDRR